jgi:hypothetical protein
MMKFQAILPTLVVLSSFSALVEAFSASTTSATSSSPTSRGPNGDMFEYLKWGGATPNFDVIKKTEEYTSTFERTSAPPGPEWYDDDYVLRGGVIGPICLKDLRETQGDFDLLTAFPDLTVTTFGHTVDPENPFRCFYFQKWRGTHTGTLMAGGQPYEGTGNYCETPVSMFTAFWTQDGKIIYEQVGAPIDRFEGTTKGKAAIFGLLHTAGLELPAAPGDLTLRLFQRLGHLLTQGRSFSKEEDIPAWWTSTSRGADATD